MGEPFNATGKIGEAKGGALWVANQNGVAHIENTLIQRAWQGSNLQPPGLKAEQGNHNPSLPKH